MVSVQPSVRPLGVRGCEDTVLYMCLGLVSLSASSFSVEPDSYVTLDLQAVWGKAGAL